MSNFMKLEEAIEIVLELAIGHALDYEDCRGIPELEKEQKRQEIALATVEDFFVNNVFSHEEPIENLMWEHMKFSPDFLSRVKRQNE